MGILSGEATQLVSVLFPFLFRINSDKEEFAPRGANSSF